MKVLLINSNTKRTPHPVPPIGLAYIASYIENKGYNVKFLDLCFSKKISEDIVSTIKVFKPEVIGISVRNIDNNTMREPTFYPKKIKNEIIDVCKENSNSKIVIGGAALGINPKELLEYFNVKYVIKGDGEEAFTNLLRAFESKISLNEVKGLVYKNKDKIIDNGFDRINEMDSLEFPRIFKYIDLSKYFLLNANIGVQTKRGCNLNCSYCSYPLIEGKEYRLRTPARIVDEIEEIIQNCNPPLIEFIDSTFNRPLDHGIKICDEIIKRNIKAYFCTSMLDVGSVTEELLYKMQDANFADIGFSPESASPITIKSLNKPFDLKQLIETVELVKKTKIPALWCFLFGAPFETEATIKENFKFIDQYIPKNHLCIISSGIRINTNTPLLNYAMKEGVISPKEDNLLHEVYYEHPRMTKDKLLYLVFKEIYKRSNCIYFSEKSFRPEWIIKLARGFNMVLNIKKPLWQVEIMIQGFSNLFGVSKINLRRHEKEYKNIF